jgi:hypothetical protein
MDKMKKHNNAAILPAFSRRKKMDNGSNRQTPELLVEIYKTSDKINLNGS